MAPLDLIFEWIPHTHLHALCVIKQSMKIEKIYIVALSKVIFTRFY